MSLCLYLLPFVLRRVSVTIPVPSRYYSSPT